MPRHPSPVVPYNIYYTLHGNNVGLGDARSAHATCNMTCDNARYAPMLGDDVEAIRMDQNGGSTVSQITLHTLHTM